MGWYCMKGNLSLWAVLNEKTCADAAPAVQCQEKAGAGQEGLLGWCQVTAESHINMNAWQGQTNEKVHTAGEGVHH